MRPVEPAQIERAQTRQVVVESAREIVGHDQGQVARLGDGLDPADQIDRRPDHREIDAIYRADIAIGHFAKLQRDPAKIILRSAYSDPKAAAWLSERARIPAVMLPYSVGGDEQAKDLFSLFDDTIQRLLAALK